MSPACRATCGPSTCPTPDLVEWRAFPRLAALAEIGWGKADYIDFSRRLPNHLELLRDLGVNYRPR